MAFIDKTYYCPMCGDRMRLIEPKDNDNWSEFYGCVSYPHCEGTRNIDVDTGKVETDEEAIYRISRNGGADEDMDFYNDDIYDWCD